MSVTSTTRKTAWCGGSRKPGNDAGLPSLCADRRLRGGILAGPVDGAGGEVPAEARAVEPRIAVVAARTGPAVADLHHRGPGGWHASDVRARPGRGLRGFHGDVRIPGREV